MSPKQVVDHFITQQAVADALTRSGCEIKQSAVANWIKRGRVPDLQQLRLQQITGGKLRAEAQLPSSHQ